MSNVDTMKYGLDPGGGHWDRLDVSRREIVHHLCGEKGLALFSFLLESSTIDPTQEHLAVCSLQRLCDVAAQLGWSADTVKRYVAVFRAVNLVHHYHTCHREVMLHLPLGLYTPLTNFSALDELIGKRKKQRQLALKVKMHYIVRFGDPTQAHSEEMRQTLQEVKVILDDEHLEPLKRERLQMKIADMFTRFMNKEGEHASGDLNSLPGNRQTVPQRQGKGTSFIEGDSKEAAGVSCGASREGQKEEPLREGDSNRQQGDFIAGNNLSLLQSVGQEGDLNPQEGDLVPSTSSESERHAEDMGDSNQQEGDLTLDILVATDSSSQVTQYEQGDSKTQQGDSTAQKNGQQPQKEGQMGDLTQQMKLEVGDSAQQAVVEVNINAPYTYNVNYLISNIGGNSVIRKQLAQFLAKVLEKSDYDNGYPTYTKYLKAFKVYNPDVVGRAFLATMVLVHRKNWQSRKLGATFTDQCKILSGQLPFAYYSLDEVEEWLKTWGNLPYSELISALAAPPQAPISSQPAPLVSALRQTSPLPSVAGQSGVSGYATRTKTTKKKGRTYGMHYTGRPSENKSFNSCGPARPPQTEQS